jgi:hypothetical protein
MTSLRTDQEPGHSWIVIIAVIGINIQTMTIHSSFAVFYQPLRDKYDASRETIGWSFSIMGIVAAMAGTY